jgi:hypothetical protein
MSNPKFPTFRKIFRWVFSWKMLRRVLISVGLLLTLIALVWTEENVRGKMAWSRYKSELEAKGEKLELADFVPPKVADDQNFAMTPLFAALYDFAPSGGSGPGLPIWRDTNAMNRAMIIQSYGSNQMPASSFWSKGELTDLNDWASFFRGKPKSASSLKRTEAAAEILRGFAPYQPQMDELLAASHRPFCRFNVAYETENPAQILLPHLAVVKSDSILFQARAAAELALGQSPESFMDIEMVLYLGDAVKAEPLLISHLVRMSILDLALQSIWEGLAEHKWSEAQLAEWQQRLARFDLLADYVEVMRAERAWGVASISFLRAHRKVDFFTGEETPVRNVMPGGWYYQNMATLCHIVTDRILPALDATGRRIWPDKMVSEDTLHQEAGRFFPFRGLAMIVLSVPNDNGFLMPVKFSSAQTKVNQAIIACALERYRLKNGKFPDSLDALKPQFIDSIPHDIINGKPLIYRHKDDGNFVLYSVGWNEKDDGGKVGKSLEDGKERLDLKTGDWVWPEYPAE